MRSASGSRPDEGTGDVRARGAPWSPAADSGNGEGLRNNNKKRKHFILLSFETSRSDISANDLYVEGEEDYTNNFYKFEKKKNSLK